MNERRRARGEVTPEGEVERLAGSRRGSAKVSQAFAVVLTRKVYAARVGIHRTTVRRWEALRIVTPRVEDVLGIPTMVFSEHDVERGQAIVKLLRANAGTMSLEQAVAAVEQQSAAAATSIAGRKGRKGRTG